MELNNRKKKILKAIIDEYIATAEPVSSKTIAQNSDLGLSSATIRNEMADLTSMGYLEQPHTSAGRIPSALGYRVYVNELMQRPTISADETEVINKSLHKGADHVEKIVSDAGKLTSQLTSYPVYAMSSAPKITIKRFDLIYVNPNTFIIVAMLSNNTVKNKLVKLPSSIDSQVLVRIAAVFNANFINLTEDKITSRLISAAERACVDESGLVSIVAGFAIEILSEQKAGEAFVMGTSHIFQHPEYQDSEKAQKLLSYLSDDMKLMDLPAPENDDIKITIGPENLAEELKDSSVIVAKYNAGNNMQGIIGVVGPTRMDYAKVAAQLSYIANGLSWLLSGGNGTFPPRLGGRSDDDEE